MDKASRCSLQIEVTEGTKDLSNQKSREVTPIVFLLKN